MELAQQSIGNRSCVKVQGASLSGEECPTISWEEFQVRKSVLSVDSFTGVTTCTPETNFIYSHILKLITLHNVMFLLICGLTDGETFISQSNITRMELQFVCEAVCNPDSKSNSAIKISIKIININYGFGLLKY